MLGHVIHIGGNRPALSHHLSYYRPQRSIEQAHPDTDVRNLFAGHSWKHELFAERLPNGNCEIRLQEKCEKSAGAT
ncbi:hypothetical protein TNCV_4443891 [Trichonephila clavipes]|nr:hypothetical protein TNCV_4443891 [Trichonephila clavipes]